MTTDWTDPETYNVIPNDKGIALPMTIFGCEIGHKYRLQIEDRASGTAMHIELSPLQALNLAKHMTNFYERATGK